MAWRWIHSPLSEPEPAMNMAIDGAIMALACDNGRAGTIRIYGWMSPVVTVGRFQVAQDVGACFPNRILVRRPTGGNAVEHGDDLTISVVARESELAELAGRGVLATHRLVVECIRRAMAAEGIQSAAGLSRGRVRDIDCFRAAHGCDLVECATGQKLLGSAQLRSGGYVLEQMSLRPVPGHDWFSEEFVNEVRKAFACVLKIADWESGGNLDASERERATRIAGSLIC